MSKRVVVALGFAGVLLQAGLASQQTVAGPQIALLKYSPPVYPEIARTARVTGTVILTASVDSGGRASTVIVERSTPLLDPAAVDAVRLWQFDKPPLGTRTVRVTVRFVLSGFVDNSDSGDVAIRTSWIPQDFAFIYFYNCRRAHVLIDSAKGRVSEDFGFPLAGGVMRHFALGSGDEQRLYLAFNRSGHFGANTKTIVPTAIPSVQVSENGVEVTVVAEAPHVDVTSIDGPPVPQRFHHQLDMREFGSWRRVTWLEPADRRDGNASTLASLGALIREVVRAQALGSGDSSSCL